MKKRDAGDIFFTVVGILILALAVAVALSAYGKVKILGFLAGAVGVAVFLAGLLSGGVLGALFAILVISVIVRFIESFPIPLAIVLGLAGIGVVIFGLKGKD